MAPDVLDEGAQPGQDLPSVGVMQESARRGDGEEREKRLQSTVGDRRLGESGPLCN